MVVERKLNLIKIVKSKIIIMSIDDETLFSKDKREMEFLLRSLEYLAAMLECIGCDAINVLCL